MPELRIIITNQERESLQAAARAEGLPSISAYIRYTVFELEKPRGRGRPPKPKPQTDSTSGAREL